jgi:hypothetical protein
MSTCQQSKTNATAEIWIQLQHRTTSIRLRNQYVATNSTNLVNNLMRIEIHENHCLMTFDIKDLYINIPVSETLNIIKTKLLQNYDTQIAEQILST